MAIEIWARARNERPDPACHAMTAGPSSLEDYFQNGALLVQKVALHFGSSIQGQIHKKMFQRFEGLSYLAYNFFF